MSTEMMIWTAAMDRNREGLLMVLIAPERNEALIQLIHQQKEEIWAQMPRSPKERKHGRKN